MGVLARDERRIAAVWERLGAVTDPELDEPVTELGFVERVEVDGGRVDVVFRLPTYWCSANFAFLMADDMRQAVAALPWVGTVRPQLQDHMVAAEINRGVELGLSFAEALREFAAGDCLDDLREKFRRKAFERRQEAVILALRAAGWGDAALCRMTLAELDAADPGGGEGSRQKPRYRELLVGRGLAAGPADRAFVTFSGRRIEPHELTAYLQRLRAVRINMEFNSTLCRGLLDSRYRGVGIERAGSCGGGCGDACTRLPAPAALAAVPA